MIERLAFAVFLLVIGFGGYRVFVRAQLSRVTAGDPLLSGIQSGIPAILYFTTPTCIPCKTVQAPALERLQQDMQVQVIRVDATDQPEAADRWGVFSAPTTFIIDGKGATQAVNHGVADYDMLKRQILSLN